tara:strand:+ start:6951 stop:8231 length:1281 start_codon:yes stop_codon:yes gene_type:complete
MIKEIFKRLEFYLILSLWAVALLGNIVSHETTPYTVNAKGLSFIIFSLIIVLSIFYSTTWIPGQREDKSKSTSLAIRLLFILTLLGLLGSLILYIKSPYSSMELSLTRIQFRESGLQIGPIKYILYFLIPCNIFAALLLIRLNFSPIVQLITIIPILLSIYLNAKAVAGRELLLATTVISIACILITYRKHIATRAAFYGTLTATLGVLFASANIFFIVTRIAGGRATESYYYRMTSDQGSDLLESIGFTDPGPQLAFSTQVVFNYLFDPVRHFCFFTEKYDRFPSMGLYTLSTVSNRVPWFDHSEYRLHIDYINSDFGLATNVWATAFRSIYVDFGYIGGLLFLAIVALSYKRLLRLSNQSVGALLLACLLLAAFLFSPYKDVVLFKSLEFYIYISICILVYEKASGTNLWNRLERINSSRMLKR